MLEYDTTTLINHANTEINYKKYEMSNVILNLTLIGNISEKEIMVVILFMY